MNNIIEQVEKDIEETKVSHERLVKHLQETQDSIGKLTLEKEKTIQLITIKSGEFQAFNKVLQMLKTQEVELG